MCSQVQRSASEAAYTPVSNRAGSRSALVNEFFHNQV
ncbi:Malolactic regulator [Lacticaseibacillus rhamnosus]|uniref:Malolactic regulator n=1 Tax=Lacticaseibacillus rhamnosus TaxID=47715 RepID=A0AB74IFG1_LACRH|nr:Malolactic regulator [Lacticaseibacillus rhamnosus]MCT3146779.1 Malolactic regulator [Lacticaseibacillus rhamnosus]MCT3150225.1 Malolactic regulator [Lacticaseibacillus rhamnosus]MCT3155987.1 Malolactic regulator [Lacticaseibacillus rhamnosus]MCT3159776.1 Malolactic regulator [Lacticaseibacillus rhamnosus]